MVQGRLIILVGPDGGGKRRLLTHARRTMLGRSLAIFPRRYIAGPVPMDHEDYYRLDDRTFADWVQRDFFALYWSDDCCRFGVGQEIDAWMDAGLHVVIAGDQNLLNKAYQRYDDVQTVLVTPGQSVLAQWLRQDVQFDDADLERRLAAAHLLEQDFSSAPQVRTEHSFEEAGRQFLALLRPPQTLKVA